MAKFTATENPIAFQRSPTNELTFGHFGLIATILARGNAPNVVIAPAGLPVLFVWERLMTLVRSLLAALLVVGLSGTSIALGQKAPPARSDLYYAGPNDGVPSGSRVAIGPPGAEQPQQNVNSPRGPGQTQTATQSAPRAPFQLTQQERDDLNKTLVAWESKSGKLKTFYCDFVRWEYDPVFFPTPPGEKIERAKTRRSGEIKYEAPDKGLIYESKVWTPNATTQELELSKTVAGDHWICDGKIIFQVDHQKREVKEIPIPPELQGQAITQGPLPFVFNAKADDLQKRYYIRVITPRELAKDQIWLEILPKYQRDAANFSQVQVILNSSDMFPMAFQIKDPGGQNRDVYQLTQKSTGLTGIFGGDFAPPFGFKHIRENLPAASPSPQGTAQSAAAPGGQAQLPAIGAAPARK